MTGQMVIKRVSQKQTKSPFRKCRVFIFASDRAESLVEQFGNRWNRPSKLYREEVMPKVLEMLNLPADAKFSWSQKAGCSCGCSPGFIFKGSELSGNDVFVDVEGAPLTDVANFEREEEAERRKLAIEADATMPAEWMGRAIDKLIEEPKVVFIRHMQCIDPSENKRKHWSVMVVKESGSWKQKRVWGRIGSEPSMKLWPFSSRQAAMDDAAKMVSSKQRKGYEVV